MSSSNPTLRKEHERAFRLVLGLLQEGAEMSLQKSCLNCCNFEEEKELCRLAKARPPARVIAYACPNHFDESEIPF